MIAQIRAELLKIRSTRTTIGLLLGMSRADPAVHAADRAAQPPIRAHGHGEPASAAEPRAASQVCSRRSPGVLLVTSEYRYGTIRPTILFNPARSQVLTAKLVAGTLAGLVFGVLGEAIGWAIGYAILNGRGITIALSSSDVLLLVLGALAGVALWGAIGTALGTIIRNQVGGVITLLAWGFVVDNLLFGLVPSVGRFMPTRGGRADRPQDAASALASAGAIILIAWAVVLAVIRHRPNRPAGYQLTLRTRANASRHRPIDRPDATPRGPRKPLILPVTRRARRAAPTIAL